MDRLLTERAFDGECLACPVGGSVDVSVPQGGNRESQAMVGSSTYYQVWDEARKYALTPAQVSSSLAGRPYDLRHAALSLWLNGGIPPTEVARRAGNSIDVLLKVYAKCIYGERDAVNTKIEGLYT